uniref:NADH-ubiquinone oxidoreductase chain 4 n=1 Tax=Lycostomus sp. YXY-2021 TaxID=2806917 RepID=A0A888YNB8_9COLE|nr:NADH dehydrogenase subunit 4 [Lycostomus sp. YXY-2021]
MKFICFFVFMIPLSFNFYLLSLIGYLFMFLAFFLSFNFGSIFSSLGYFLGCDYLSFYMVSLSIWICFLMILASESIYSSKNYFNLFLLVIWFLFFSLFVTFTCMNLFIFYLFFEISLIPTLMLILGWGYQPERIQAGMYMFMYTLMASLPMLIAIFYLNNVFFSLDFFFFFPIDSYFLYFSMNLVFFVKMPMFMVHLWLPKAHVEAPIAGSMILAGVMLKLGGYGLIRLIMVFSFVGFSLNMIISSISLVGGFFVTLICLRQSDIKSLIAYSSVSHMALVLAGILTMNSYGLFGSLVMMVAHGLCSSGLFCLANLSYERVGSRSFFLNKGFMNLLPNLSLWWFLFSSFNMAAPPSFNLLGEIMLINSIVSWGYISIFTLMLMSFFCASYCLYLYSFSQHGKLYSGLYSFHLVNIREYLLLFFHFIPLILLSLSCDLIF